MADTWSDTSTAGRARLAPGTRFDEIIVGAGIAGLATALMLAERGRRVVVIDARRLGSGTSSHAGGQISRLQGIRLSEVAARNTPAVTVAYAQSQTAAFDWLSEFVQARGVHAERRDAVTFAIGERGGQRVVAERELAAALGFPVERQADAGLPWRTSAAIRLADQLHVDPSALIDALAAAVRSAGGVIIDESRVLRVAASAPAVVTTEHGDLVAERVIIATGAPILDRGLYFAKLAPRRGYLLEARIPEGEMPSSMATGVDSPLRTVRSGGGLLITRGGEHGVGRAASPAAVAAHLAAETARWWPEAEHLGTTSVQDYETPHRVPFVGWLPRGRGRIFLATGFGQWGITNGVAAALTLCADLLGAGTEWQRVLHRRLTLPTAIGAGLGEAAAVTSWYVRGWFGALTAVDVERPPEGGGVVGHEGLLPVGLSTVDGETRAVCAVCPHLGAIVTWNDLEHSWDCPAHGSRFAADGSPIEGPARRGLTPLL